MPLKPGKSKIVVSENISEFHGGRTYQHTKEKFGKETADKQAIAAALNEQRKSGGGQKMKNVDTSKVKKEKIK